MKKVKDQTQPTHPPTHPISKPYTHECLLSIAHPNHPPTHPQANYASPARPSSKTKARQVTSKRAGDPREKEKKKGEEEEEEEEEEADGLHARRRHQPLRQHRKRRQQHPKGARGRGGGGGSKEAQPLQHKVPPLCADQAEWSQAARLPALCPPPQNKKPNEAKQNMPPTRLMKVLRHENFFLRPYLADYSCCCATYHMDLFRACTERVVWCWVVGGTVVPLMPSQVNSSTRSGQR